MKRERGSWHDEHAEVMRRASKMTLGSKWNFGCYQVVWDKDPPVTKFKDNDLTEFLVPESHLSLKLYFDNLRNYGICGAFAALGSWAWLHINSALPSQSPTWVGPSIAAVIWTLVAIALCLNCMQTWILTRELYLSIRALRIAKLYVYRGGNIGQFVLGAVHGLATWLIDVLIGLLALLVSVTVVAISLGFVIYAVMGRMGSP